MSYEHCEKHDCDATNGCQQCWEEAVKLAINEVRNKLLKDGLDPEHLTLKDAIRYLPLDWNRVI